ncbi:MAG TPA: DUF3574 domain-containing protein [Stellaceae bacterium]|jgi:hypothetical protein
MSTFRAILLAALPFALLAGCVPPPSAAGPSTPQAAAAPTPSACLMPNQHKMIVAELFFGRTRAGHRAVTDAEWTRYLADTLTPNFPDGLTVFDGYGQSRNPATGVIGRSEGVKIVLIAADPTPDLPTRLNAVIDTYKSRFAQRSVGLITREECAGF